VSYHVGRCWAAHDNSQQGQGAEAAPPCVPYPGNKSCETATIPPLRPVPTTVTRPAGGAIFAWADLGQQQPASRYGEPGNQSIEQLAHWLLRIWPWNRLHMQRRRNIFYVTGTKQLQTTEYHVLASIVGDSASLSSSNRVICRLVEDATDIWPSISRNSMGIG